MGTRVCETRRPTSSLDGIEADCSLRGTEEGHLTWNPERVGELMATFNPNGS